MADRITGSCLCGGVQFEVSGPLRPVVVCHCRQCRKTSGHYAAATQTRQADVTIRGDTLRWYRSSEHAQRGFCAVCGGNLFWRRVDSPMMSIMAGMIDGPTGLRTACQLYPESAGDYYDLPDVPVVAHDDLPPVDAAEGPETGA